MNCPNLEKWIILSRCSAVESDGAGRHTSYIPSIFQITEYCKSKNHLKCPFYLSIGGKREKSLIAV